jgi:hypothetical protein
VGAGGPERLEDDEFLEAPVEAAGPEGLNQEVRHRAAHLGVARHHSNEIGHVAEVGLGAVQNVGEHVVGLSNIEGGCGRHGNEDGLIREKGMSGGEPILRQCAPFTPVMSWGVMS